MVPAPRRFSRPDSGARAGSITPVVLLASLLTSFLARFRAATGRSGHRRLDRDLLAPALQRRAELRAARQRHLIAGAEVLDRHLAPAQLVVAEKGHVVYAELVGAPQR